MSEPLRVTDLEEFSFDHIWRPYWPSYNRGDLPRPADVHGLARLTKAPRDLDGTANALMVDDEWSQLVINRLGRIGVDFPAWMRHPLVDVVRESIEDWQFARSIPTDLDARKAEAKALVLDQAWPVPTDDDEEIDRLRQVILGIVDAIDRGAAVPAGGTLRATTERPVKRRIVHVVATFGADWDAEDVIASIDRATAVTWRRHGGLTGGHQLVIAGDPQTFNGRAFAVGVVRPKTPETTGAAS